MSDIIPPMVIPSMSLYHPDNMPLRHYDHPCLGYTTQTLSHPGWYIPPRHYTMPDVIPPRWCTLYQAEVVKCLSWYNSDGMSGWYTTQTLYHPDIMPGWYNTTPYHVWVVYHVRYYGWYPDIYHPDIIISRHYNV